MARMWSIMGVCLTLLSAGMPTKGPLKPYIKNMNVEGFKLVFADEFNEVSWTDKSPKGKAKWFCAPSLPGKYIGFQTHSKDSMVIKNGILVNILSIRVRSDVKGSFCAGPVGMKDGSGKELVRIQSLGSKIDSREGLVWGTAGWVGMKFIPSHNITISQLGRYNIAGSKGFYDIRIFDGVSGDDVAKAIVDLKGQPDGWVYAPLVGKPSVTLRAGHPYYLMTNTLGWDKEKNNYIVDHWYDGKSAVIASSGITISESVWGVWDAGSLFSLDPTRAGFTQQYGYWEARVKMPIGGLGVWPSFCLYTIGKPNSNLGEEIDIFEYYGNAYEKNTDGGFGMRNHNWGEGPKEAEVDVWPAVSKPWQNWHIYGFLATPTKCVFYIDGEPVREFPTPRSYLNSPMYMTLEYNIGGWWPITGLVANSHMDVDWVRVWALPEELLEG